MARNFVLSTLCLLLSACAGGPEWSLLIKPKPANVAAAAQYSFAWRLSGDRAVAPLQVFDNGRRMWLQFGSARALPAIFERRPSGDRPVPYTREGPYVVLQGVWPLLVLRGGRLSSIVERVDAVAAPIPETDVESQPAAASADPLTVPARTAASSLTQAEPESVAALTAVSFPTLPQEPSTRYSVTPKDINLRTVLSRWAIQAGWTFEPEHWAVNADIPIAGSASFEPGFKTAVQQLMASTELADRPLQPCFYSNRVLRVVPYAQPCDRTAGAVESS